MIKAVFRWLLIPGVLIPISFITRVLWQGWYSETRLMNKWGGSDTIVKKEYGYGKKSAVFITRFVRSSSLCVGKVYMAENGKNEKRMTIRQKAAGRMASMYTKGMYDF